jgi:alpha-mannosidase
VTATCSTAEHTRYGHLEVDSNLPDARICVGTPEDNVFTAAVLAAADPVYAAEVTRQLAAGGSARVFIPAASSLAAVWIPDADLRGVLALPVLIVAGDIDAVVADLADAEIRVDQQIAADCGPFESRTVALINRGVPGFAVERDGTLHSSLMRSCTGWPSGVWIDPPARKAPDGSNFQLQHWSHTFDFALVCGDGDWRAVEMPSRSAEFNHPLLAVVADAGGGELPADGSLLRVEPARTVQLGACKVAGNPTATGSSAEADHAAVTLRLVETTGAPTDVAITSAVAELSELVAADLLEAPRLTAGPPLRLHGYQIATLGARLEATPLIDAGEVALAPDAEAAQPLYARYWLHNRGPAPLGGLPAVAHLHPEALTAAPGETVHLRLTVASDCSDATLSGAVRMRNPWEPDGEFAFALPARGHRQDDIAVTVPADAEPGHYPLRAALTLSGELPPAWRQSVEDVCVITVGDPGGALLRLVTDPVDVVVTRGQSARIAVTVGTDARADLALEAHLISPWGTWEWIGPASRGAVLPAGGTVEVGFEVTPPPWTTPGSWWALIRIGCAGQLLYTPAVAVSVR